MSFNPCSISQSLLIFGAFILIVVIGVVLMLRSENAADRQEEERRREHLSDWYARSGKAMRALDV